MSEPPFPPLLEEGSRAVRHAITARIPGFTPDWTPGGDGADAGVALVRAFAEQAEPVVARVNRLPEKHAREALRIAGLNGRGPRVGAVTVRLRISPSAAGSVTVPAGTQLMAPAADGSGPVVFETVRDLLATPAVVGGLAVSAGTRSAPVDPALVTATSPVLPFGPRPRAGAAWWIGLAGPPAAPHLTLAVDLAPRPGAGSVAVPGTAADTPGAPALVWEALTSDGLVPLEVRHDATGALGRSGLVELGTRADWPPRAHPGLPGTPGRALRWLRVVLRHGRFAHAPAVTGVALNAVVAEGAETVRDEVLEPLPETGPATTRSATRRFRTARSPVLGGTMVLRVDAPDPGDLFDVGGPTGPGPAWTEVASLARSRPWDQHFVVDPATGVVTFGDGVRGAAVPDGFRHVLAERYRTGGGRRTAVPADGGLVARQSIPFLVGIDNPLPASGAADAESVEETTARGPALVRARNRAATPADVEALALSASPEVARVVALPGADERGVPHAGRVTVLALGVPGADAAPPVPTDAVLGDVARFLADERERLLPLGARLVVRAATFATVTVEVTVAFTADTDRAATVLAITAAIDARLDPVRDTCWRPGGVVAHRGLVAAIAAVAGVDSVGRLVIDVDGRPAGPFGDGVLPDGALPWPGVHAVVPAGGRP